MLIGLASAAWLGILTSISPCPLATNIAAISFIGRRVANARYVVTTGLLYTLGRSVVYIVLGAVLVSSLLTTHVVSQFLQDHMSKLLGPILILVGMILLDLLRFNMRGAGVGEKLGQRVESLGVWGGLVLGVVFALSFCPGSAALFFLSLVSLAIKYESRFLVPLVYGVGTALPVMAFAILIAVGTGAVGRAFNKITQFELWARRVTGVIFIGLGIYFCLAFIFDVL